MIAAVADIRRFRTSSVKSLYSDFAVKEIQGISLRKSELLPLEGQQIWLIEQGYVRTVNYSDAGDVVTLGVWGQGDIVGRPLSNSQTYDVECLTTVTVRSIRLSQVNLAEIRAKQVQQMEMFLGLLHCRPLPLRLWRLLDWLGQKYSQIGDRGLMIDVRLTHQAIAEMIGSTRVTVSRLLKEFEAEGKLVKLGHQKLLLSHQSGCARTNYDSRH